MSFTSRTAVLSNVQENIVRGNPHDTVLKLRSYPFEFVGYSAWRKRIGRRKRRNPKNAKDIFYALVPFHFEEQLAFVCVQPTLLLAEVLREEWPFYLLSVFRAYESGHTIQRGYILQTSGVYSSDEGDKVDRTGMNYRVH